MLDRGQVMLQVWDHERHGKERMTRDSQLGADLPGIPQCLCAIVLGQSEKMCRFKLRSQDPWVSTTVFLRINVHCDSWQGYDSGLMQGTTTRNQQGGR
jgi:hypothetical protein